jgi:Kef-type K+ transport system membrane component KefB/Trk K+ transport system NAD-binding subunit
LVLSFVEYFGLLFIIIVVFSFIVKIAKQPIIIGYILSGLFFSFILVGDTVIGESLTIFAELGITFLLFLMGLEFDLRNFKFLGKDIFITTAIQSFTFFIFAFALASFFPFTIMEKIYLSILFMFGSTLLVAKWVEDKKETGTLHSKLIMGTLIVQDLFAIITITILSVISEKNLINIVLAPIEGLILLGIAFILAKYVLNKMLRFASKYPELLFIFSLGICFAFVEIAPLLGYSTTIGAFIAGVTLANTVYRNDVSSRLKPLIVFFNMLFFVGLGFQMNLSLRPEMYLFIFLMIILCFLTKPIITYLTLRYRGYDVKTAALSGIYLSQLSEFGIIIIAGGVGSGIVDLSLSSIAIISVITSMVISSYFIKADKKIYHAIEPFLQKWDKKIIKKDLAEQAEIEFDCNILFIGYYELGKNMYSKLNGMGKKILVIEMDPQNIESLEQEKIPYVYGTVTNPEFFEKIPFEKIELVVSSLTDIEDNKMIIKSLKEKNEKAIAIVNAKSLKDSLDLYNHNADYVIYPTYVNEQQVSVLLNDYTTDIHKVISKKIEDIANLKEKQEKAKTKSQDNSMMYEIDHFVQKLTGQKNKNDDKEDDEEFEKDESKEEIKEKKKAKKDKKDSDDKKKSDKEETEKDNKKKEKETKDKEDSKEKKKESKEDKE